MKSQWVCRVCNHQATLAGRLNTVTCAVCLAWMYEVGQIVDCGEYKLRVVLDQR